MKKRSKEIAEPKIEKEDPPNLKAPEKKEKEEATVEDETVLEKKKPEIIVDENVRSAIKERAKTKDINPAPLNEKDENEQGSWTKVPHDHEKPFDGKNMYRELSTPAFQENKSKDGLFSSI